jgi:hypothetical protein
MEVSLALLASEVYQIFCYPLLWRGDLEFSQFPVMLASVIKSSCNGIPLLFCISPALLHDRGRMSSSSHPQGDSGSLGKSPAFKERTSFFSSALVLTSPSNFALCNIRRTFPISGPAEMPSPLSSSPSSEVLT